LHVEGRKDGFHAQIFCIFERMEYEAGPQVNVELHVVYLVNANLIKQKQVAWTVNL